MTAKILPFNQSALPPQATAQTFRLPVESKGLHQIVTDRYAAQTARIKNANNASLEKLAAFKNAHHELQEKLDLIAQCAKGYFRKNQIPADAACALFAALTGDMTACYWQEDDAKQGWGLYQCMPTLEQRIMRDTETMRDETNPQWRKIIFIRQVMLLNDLRNSIRATSANDIPIDPRHYEAYRKATDIVWPKSPLSASIASTAKKLRNTCTKTGQNPPTQRVV